MLPPDPSPLGPTHQHKAAKVYTSPLAAAGVYPAEGNKCPFLEKNLAASPSVLDTVEAMLALLNHSIERLVWAAQLDNWHTCSDLPTPTLLTALKP